MAQRLTSPISEQLKAGASTKNAEPLNHYQYEKPISDNYDKYLCICYSGSPEAVRDRMRKRWAKITVLYIDV